MKMNTHALMLHIVQELCFEYDFNIDYHEDCNWFTSMHMKFQDDHYDMDFNNKNYDLVVGHVKRAIKVRKIQQDKEKMHKRIEQLQKKMFEEIRMEIDSLVKEIIMETLPDDDDD